MRMAMESTQRTSCQSAPSTPSARKRSSKTRKLPSKRRTRVWQEQRGVLCHDDKVADFGGNDGRSSFCFYQKHKIKPLVVDCEPQRLQHAANYYHMETYQTFVEDMHDLKDDSIDWGFCSHTLEHTRDNEKAMRESARVIT